MALFFVYLVERILKMRKSKSEPYAEKVYGSVVCEECDRWTEVVYKCYVAAPVEDYKAGIPVGNVVYKCYECAFGEGD